jgi:hypothetical protein
MVKCSQNKTIGKQVTTRGYVVTSPTYSLHVYISGFKLNQRLPGACDNSSSLQLRVFKTGYKRLPGACKNVAFEKIIFNTEITIKNVIF